MVRICPLIEETVCHGNTKTDEIHNQNTMSNSPNYSWATLATLESACKGFKAVLKLLEVWKQVAHGQQPLTWDPAFPYGLFSAIKGM